MSLGQLALLRHVLQRLDGQIGIHRARAIADQQRRSACTSRGSPDSMISATCVRVPSRIKMIVHGGQRQQARESGAYSSSMPRSERISSV